MSGLFKISLLTSLLVMSTCTLAKEPTPPKPSACPSVEVITSRDAQFTHAQGAWIGIAAFVPFANKFGTSDAWYFASIISDHVETEPEAVAIANRYRASITKVEGPIFSDNIWACVYTNDQPDRNFMMYTALASSVEYNMFTAITKFNRI